MKKYILKRILTSLFTLLAILLVLFILMKLMPGSPFNDEKLTDDMRAALYAKYGLDQPVIVQFFKYVTGMLRGDLGVSYNISKNTPISQLIQTRLPISIQIGGMAVLLGAVVGLVLGIIAALKRDTIWDTLATIISVIGVSVPSYVFALALSYSFGFRLQWFPMLFSASDITGSSVLPSISLSMFTMASIARFTRSEMLEVLPNIIGPIITQIMFSIPTAIFTEAFLSFVGLGIPVPQRSLGSLINELYNSFTPHPYQIIPPITVMVLLMLSFNLVADGLREALDPKMKSM